MDPQIVFSHLLADRQGYPAKVVPEPGVFAVFVGQATCLPLIDVPPTGLVYIGEAANTAERSPFVAAGKTVSTFWRTLGAVLKDCLDLVAVAGTGDQAVRHYQFAGCGEDRLYQWICCHLLYSTCPVAKGGKDARVALKKKLLLAYEPPLNLQDSIHQQTAKIRALKRVCREEAAR